MQMELSNPSENSFRPMLFLYSRCQACDWTVAKTGKKSEGQSVVRKFSNSDRFRSKKM